MAVKKIYELPDQSSTGGIVRFEGRAFAAFLLIAAGSLSAATQYVAARFDYSQSLGESLYGHLYAPWKVVVWMARFDRPDYGQAVMRIFETAHIFLFGGALLGLLVAAAIILRRRSKRIDLHGSAHFATDEEVQRAGVLPDDKNKGGVVFGAFRDKKGRVRYLRHKGPEHMLVFAPTRSGKGVGIVIPTLLSWDQSVLVHDIKGENWFLTSGFRRAVLKQRTIKFDPTARDSARFNPLAEIRINERLVPDVQNITAIIVDPDGKGLNDHWAKTGHALMTGVVLFVILYDWSKIGGGENMRNLATVQSIMSNGGPIRVIAEQAAIDPDVPDGHGDKIEGVEAVMMYIRDHALGMQESSSEDVHRRIGWRTAAEAAQEYLNKAPNEASGVMSTALSFLTLYRDPIVAENTSVSDFTIESLMGGVDVDGQACAARTALYVVVPPSDKDRLKPLIRLVVNQVTRRLTEGMEFEKGGSSKSRFPHRLLLLLDEFPALGKLDIFQEALAFIAGYGLKALLITQDLSQLHAAYSKDEAIMSNCHIRIAYAPNKVETAEALSKMAGEMTVAHMESSGARKVSVLGAGDREQLSRRSLLTPDECMRLPPEDELVFVAGHAPIYCQKVRYYADPALAERIKFGPSPDTGRRPGGGA